MLKVESGQQIDSNENRVPESKKDDVNGAQEHVARSTYSLGQPMEQHAIEKPGLFVTRTQNAEIDVGEVRGHVQFRGRRVNNTIKQVILSMDRHRPLTCAFFRVSLAYLHLQGRRKRKSGHNFGGPFNRRWPSG